MVVVTFSAIVKKTRWNVKKRNVKVSLAIFSIGQFRNSRVCRIDKKVAKRNRSRTMYLGLHCKLLCVSLKLIFDFG